MKQYKIMPIKGRKITTITHIILFEPVNSLLIMSTSAYIQRPRITKGITRITNSCKPKPNINKPNINKPPENL
jgi:hypothetical protein